jgi:hypothetical protein
MFSQGNTKNTGRNAPLTHMIVVDGYDVIDLSAITWWEESDGYDVIMAFVIICCLYLIEIIILSLSCLLILIIKRILGFLSPAIRYLDLFFSIHFWYHWKALFPCMCLLGFWTFLIAFKVQFLAIRITWRIISVKIFQLISNENRLQYDQKSLCSVDYMITLFLMHKYCMSCFCKVS